MHHDYLAHIYRTWYPNTIGYTHSSHQHRKAMGTRPIQGFLRGLDKRIKGTLLLCSLLLVGVDLWLEGVKFLIPGNSTYSQKVGSYQCAWSVRHSGAYIPFTQHWLISFLKTLSWSVIVLCWLCFPLQTVYKT